MTPLRYKVVLENLRVAQLLKKFPFTESEVTTGVFTNAPYLTEILYTFLISLMRTLKLF
jgi:hypothetical protein